MDEPMEGKSERREEVYFRADEVPLSFDEDGVPQYEAPFHIPRD
jgi:hypothetical protein